jgi:hypothetical protein
MPNRPVLNPVPLGAQWRASAKRALMTETEGMQQLIAAIDGPWAMASRWPSTASATPRAAWL